MPRGGSPQNRYREAFKRDVVILLVVEGYSRTTRCSSRSTTRRGAVRVTPSAAVQVERGIRSVRSRVKPCDTRVPVWCRARMSGVRGIRKRCAGGPVGCRSGSAAN